MCRGSGVFADLRFLDPEVDGGPVSRVVFGHALLHGCREREPSYAVTQQLLTFEVNTDLTVASTHISVLSAPHWRSL